MVGFRKKKFQIKCHTKEVVYETADLKLYIGHETVIFGSRLTQWRARGTVSVSKIFLQPGTDVKISFALPAHFFLVIFIHFENDSSGNDKKVNVTKFQC